MKKNILFLMESYPAIRSANVHCDMMVINELKKNSNINLSIIANRYHNQKKVEKSNDRFQIIRLNEGLIKRVFNISLVSKNTFFENSMRNIYSYITKIKQILFIPIYPIYKPIALLKLYFKTNSFVKQNKVDMIIAEYHDLNTLYVGYLIKKKYSHIKFVPIFWDPLAHKKLPSYLPYNYSKKRHFDLENRIISISNKTILMNTYKNQYLDINEKQIFLGIPFLSEFNFTNKTIKNDITILYGGTIDLESRNPTSIIKILDKLENYNIKLIFISQGTAVKQINKLKNEVNYEIDVIPYLPKEDYEKYLEKADCFLNIGNNFENSIPSKLLEYISYGKPIISTFTIDNDTCIPVLKKYSKSCILDVRNITKSISDLSLFLKNVNEIKIDYKDIIDNFKVYSPKEYYDIIISLFD